MVRLNLNLDNVQNFEETTAFVKKVVFNLAYILGLSFERFKKRDKFRASKSCKSTRKASKTQNGNRAVGNGRRGRGHRDLLSNFETQKR